MVSVYRPKLKRQSALRYGLLRNLLISCKIPYGRLDTISPPEGSPKVRGFARSPHSFLLLRIWASRVDADTGLTI